MTDESHYQYSNKIGTEIHVLTTPLEKGLDFYIEQVKALRERVEQEFPPEAAVEPTKNGASKQPFQRLDGEKSFEVESVKLASGGEHPRWTIKGGNFKKFGVTVWPETLEAAGMMEHLDPLKENKPQATWTAYYVEKLNDEGKAVPDKIVRLAKA
jgi:hypothetical protein